MRAYYTANKEKFYYDTETQILGELTKSHNFPLENNQKQAWLQEIIILKSSLENISDFTIFFEFSIPRMGKRADVVILSSNIVFILEFKAGKEVYDRSDIEQVEDYALDLKNFHSGSHNLTIFPILIPTNSLNSTNVQFELPIGQVSKPMLVSKSDIGKIIEFCLKNSTGILLDANEWSNSGYRPTPTIIEAARCLYSNHNVEEIARYDAGAVNLTETNNAVNEIIEFSKLNGKKSIIFITGVPGAGKTLAGLNIATSRFDKDKANHATFLSGNGPLVDVLKEALTRDEHKRNGGTKSNAERKVRNFIQNIHKFRDEYVNNHNIPSDHIVIFDEAQRAWNSTQASKFMQSKRGISDFQMSEPEFLISVMDRRQDWCTIVCLIGGGQEINVGEAGLSEWVEVIRNRFQDWSVFASSNITKPEYDLNLNASKAIQEKRIQIVNQLHLNVSLRSFRAESLSEFISEVLNANSKTAKILLEKIKDNYPIYITRNLKNAKSWIQNKARGSESYGLIASSGANRLKPEGINVKQEIDPANWFLNDKTDVRSSYYLEDVATEFHVQGLELDYTLVCWDANLRFVDNYWQSYDFKGTKWQTVKDNFRKLYLKNAYRVILTRARQGFIIYVPLGEVTDPTRPPMFYNQTFEFLKSCGIKEI